MRYRRRILDISQKVTALHRRTGILLRRDNGCDLPRTDAFPRRRKGFQGRVLMSKGHGCMTQYAISKIWAFCSSEELDRYCTPQGILGGSSGPRNPGIEASTGSLGTAWASRWAWRTLKRFSTPASDNIRRALGWRASRRFIVGRRE